MDMMGYKQIAATAIAQDNNACIFLVKGSGMYNRARHIDTRVYRIRELATGATSEIKLYKIAGTEQPSDRHSSECRRMIGRMASFDFSLIACSNFVLRLLQSCHHRPCHPGRRLRQGRCRLHVFVVKHLL